MTAPVRLLDEDKAQLGRLQAEVAAATGRKPTQQETLGKVLEFAARHRDRFLLEASWKPFTREELRAWDRAIGRLKGWKSVPVRDIDEVVYGPAAAGES